MEKTTFFFFYIFFTILLHIQLHTSRQILCVLQGAQEFYEMKIQDAALRQHQTCNNPFLWKSSMDMEKKLATKVSAS